MKLFFFVLIAILLTVFFFLRTAAKERKRRNTARRLFLKAKSFQANNRHDEAYDVLHFIRWELVDKQWFEEFIDTDTVVTQKDFMELNSFLMGKISR